MFILKSTLVIQTLTKLYLIIKIKIQKTDNFIPIKNTLFGLLLLLKLEKI